MNIKSILWQMKFGIYRFPTMCNGRTNVENFGVYEQKKKHIGIFAFWGLKLSMVVFFNILMFATMHGMEWTKSGLSHMTLKIRIYSTLNHYSVNIAHAQIGWCWIKQIEAGRFVIPSLHQLCIFNLVWIQFTTILNFGIQCHTQLSDFPDVFAQKPK